MKKVIYKYENKINHKIYIGQTNNIERRHREHLNGHSFQTSLIERAIQKYGIDNFNFEILEITSDYNAREQYWIEYYKSYKPYGYNICEGGGYLPNYQGENHPQSTITEEVARKIQQDLMNFSIPQIQIVKKYKTTIQTVEAIKSGHTWNYYNLSYPLRPSESELNDIKAKKVIELLKNTSLSFKDIGKKVGWGNSQVSMINCGTNHPQQNESYPIRKNPKDYANKLDKCIQLLQDGKTNKEIAELLEVSAAWVSRVNTGATRKQENLSYPIRK